MPTPPERIVLPSTAGADNFAVLLDRCRRLELSQQDVILDATQCSRYEPFAIALLAASLARRHQSNYSVPTWVPPADSRCDTFFKEVAFDEFLGGSSVRPSATYGTLRMRRLDRLDVAYVQQLAEMLVERVPGTSIDAGHFVKLCLNELLQNVFEHSESRFGCFVLARWYAAERNVKIIVVDGGIGIPAALRRELVDNLQRAPEFEIVREAVTREGLTSRKTGRLGGLGLKHIHGLVTARGGRLIVLTHQTRVVFKKDHFGHRKNRVFFAGTAIELDFRPYDQPSGSAAVPDEVF